LPSGNQTNSTFVTEVETLKRNSKLFAVCMC
jgi:hypothetical protein